MNFLFFKNQIYNFTNRQNLEKNIFVIDLQCLLEQRKYILERSNRAKYYQICKP